MTTSSATRVEAALAALLATAEAAVLPFVGGFRGDEIDVVGIQAGGVAAEMGFFSYLGSWIDVTTFAGTAGGLNFMNGEQAYRDVIILGATLAVIQSLALLNGFGRPDSGDEFDGGVTGFGGQISDILQMAVSDEWSGEGATEYGGCTGDQRARLVKMMTADHRIAGIVKKQADEVELGHEVLAAAQLGLAAGIPVAGRLYAQYLHWRCAVPGPLGSHGIALIIAVVLHRYVTKLCLAAIAATVGMIAALVDEGVRHRDLINDAVREGYEWVVADVRAKHPMNAAPAASADGPRRAFLGVVENESTAANSAHEFAWAGDPCNCWSGGRPVGGPGKAPSQASAPHQPTYLYKSIGSPAGGRAQQLTPPVQRSAVPANQLVRKASATEGVPLADALAWAVPADQGGGVVDVRKTASAARAT